MKMDISKKIKIESVHRIRLETKEFIECAKGRKSFITHDNNNYKVGDQISLLEFVKGNYTGKEILGEISYIEDNIFSFKKWCVLTERVKP